MHPNLMKFLDFFHCNILRTNSFLYFHPLDHTTGNVELEEKTKLAIKSNYGASVSIWLKKALSLLVVNDMKAYWKAIDYCTLIININILHTVLFTFPLGLIRRIFLLAGP